MGDVPPAYVVVDDCPTPRDALQMYVEEMHRWISAARDGSSLDDVIPMNVAPTRENADRLNARLDLLKREFLS